MTFTALLSRALRPLPLRRAARPGALAALALVALLVSALAACGRAGTDPLVAAGVDGQPISLSAFRSVADIYALSAASQGQTTAWQSPAGRGVQASTQSGALDFLITCDLLDAQVHRLHLAVGGKAVAQQANALLSSLNAAGSGTTDPNLLALQRAAREAAREAANAPSMADLLTGRPTLAQGILIFARELADENALKAVVRVPQAHVRLIEAATRQQAAQLEQQALHGADFGKLAQQHSLDKPSAARGGDIGTILVGQLAQQSAALDTAIFGPGAPGAVGSARPSYVMVPYQGHELLCEISRRQLVRLSSLDPQQQGNVFGAWLAVVLRPSAQVQQYVAVDPTPAASGG
jgi:hypothetical protein